MLLSIDTSRRFTKNFKNKTERMYRLTKKEYAELREMDRAQVETMTNEEMKEELQRFQSNFPDDRAQLIDALMMQLERHETTLQKIRTTSVSSDRSHTSTSAAVQPETEQSVTSGMLKQIVTTITAQFQSQQEQLIRQFEQWAQQVVTITERQMSSMGPGIVEGNGREETRPSPAVSASSLRATGTTPTAMNAVSLLVPQIPEFGGTETENVRVWVQ